MAWHDETPWRKRQRDGIKTTTQQIDDLERSLSAGHMSPAEALNKAFLLGIAEGRANPAVKRIGESNGTEVRT